MGTLRYIGAANSVKQIDAIDYADTWASGDSVVFEINNKQVVPVNQTGTNTPALSAAAAAEVLNADHHDTDTYTASVSAEIGGQEIGEFRDIEAIVESSTSLQVKSARAGHPFTLDVTETTAGDGTATHTAEAQEATGPHHVDNTANYDTGALPTTGDTVIVPAGFELLYGFENLDSGINWKFEEGVAVTRIGLPETNTYHELAAYHYKEYRTRKAAVGPDGTDDVVIVIENSGQYFLDLGTAVPTSMRVFHRKGTVELSGGKVVQYIQSGGTAWIGTNTEEADVELKKLELSNTEAVCHLGTECTITNSVGDNLEQRTGRLTVHCVVDGSNNKYYGYGGTLLIAKDAHIDKCHNYGTAIDWRGLEPSVYIGYAGSSINLDLCEEAQFSLALEMFKDAIVIDRQNIAPVIDTNGCQISEITCIKKPVHRHTFGDPGSVAVE